MNAGEVCSGRTGSNGNVAGDDSTVCAADDVAGVAMDGTRVDCTVGCNSSGASGTGDDGIPALADDGVGVGTCIAGDESDTDATDGTTTDGEFPLASCHKRASTMGRLGRSFHFLASHISESGMIAWVQ